MEQIDGFISTFMASDWVYWAIFVLAIAEACALTSFFLSGTIGLVVVGVLIAQGMLDPIFSIAAVYFGTLIGDVTTFVLSSQLQKIRYIRSAIDRFEPIREPLSKAPLRFILVGHFTPYRGRRPRDADPARSAVGRTVPRRAGAHRGAAG